jgi:hypothetical protein
VKNKRPHSCNVLDPSPAARHVWQFVVDRNELKAPKNISIPAAGPVDPKLGKVFQKDWTDLYQPKLNIAWLPANQVFLRVVQLPLVDRAELLSMLEFQLEKLSPMPVAQVVWSAEVLPSAAEKMQTAIVCIVAREVVEDFLGTLDEQRYQPDRLEIPQINQILADGVRTDGAWIYPGTGQEADLCVAAWWYGGTLQELQLIRLPAPAGSDTAIELAATRAQFLEEQLMQSAWAGELEGWLTMPVKWHLVATDEAAALWQPLLAQWAEDTIEVVPALNREGLARFSAARAARQEPASNLLPPEFGAKYHQQFIDRLWMRGLGALVGVYLLGVAAYMIALQVYSYRQESVQAQVATLANTYTNVLQLKERVQILQEQLNLKYAALDCWKVTAENLPAEFNLTWLMFTRGRILELHGTAPPGQEAQVTDFNEALRRATVNGQLLFKDVAPPISLNRPGSPNITWNFQSQLNITEEGGL